MSIDYSFTGLSGDENWFAGVSSDSFSLAYEAEEMYKNGEIAPTLLPSEFLPKMPRLKNPEITKKISRAKRRKHEQ